MKCPKKCEPSKILLPLYTLDSRGVCVKDFDTATFNIDLIGPQMSAWMENVVKQDGLQELVRFIKCLDCTGLIPKYRFYTFSALARRGQYYPSPYKRAVEYERRGKSLAVYRLNNWRRLALLRWRDRYGLLIGNLNEIFRADIYAFLYGGSVISDSKWKKIQTAMRSYEVNHNVID